MTVSWRTLTIPDTKGLSTSISLDLVPGSAPLIVGMDVWAYYKTFNLGKQKYIKMRRLTDRQEICLSTYLVKHDTGHRLEISPHPKSKVSTLLSSAHTTAKELSLRPSEIFTVNVFCWWWRRNNECENESVNRDSHSGLREICQERKTKLSRKVSLSHVDEAFNQELQMYFQYVVLRGARRTVGNRTDTGTSYSELFLATDKCMKTIIHAIESSWVLSMGLHLQFPHMTHIIADHFVIVSFRTV